MARSIGGLFGAVSFVAAVLFCFFSLLLAGGQVNAASFAPMKIITSNILNNGFGCCDIQGRVYEVGPDRAFIHRVKSQGVVSRPQWTYTGEGNPFLSFHYHCYSSVPGTKWRFIINDNRFNYKKDNGINSGLLVDITFIISAIPFQYEWHSPLLLFLFWFWFLFLLLLFWFSSIIVFSSHGNCIQFVWCGAIFRLPTECMGRYDPLLSRIKHSNHLR